MFPGLPEVFFCIASPASSINLYHVQSVRHLDKDDNVIVGYTSSRREEAHKLQVMMSLGWSEILFGEDIDRFDDEWENYGV